MFAAAKNGNVFRDIYPEFIEGEFMKIVFIRS